MRKREDTNNSTKGKRVTKFITVALIAGAPMVNHFLNIIEFETVIWAIAIILLCIFLMQETIYKCVDRICTRDEIREKEITKRLNNEKSNPKKISQSAPEEDCKLYEIKHKKSS